MTAVRATQRVVRTALCYCFICDYCVRSRAFVVVHGCKLRRHDPQKAEVFFTAWNVYEGGVKEKLSNEVQERHISLSDFDVGTVRYHH